MAGNKSIVDEASDESFPASDPPSWTPVTGSGNPHTLKVLTVATQKVIYIDSEQGDQLREFLAAHGIISKVCAEVGTPFERLEILVDVEADKVQELIDQWDMHKIA